MYLIANNFKKIFIFDKYEYKKSILIKDNKNSLFSSYHHTTNLGVWSYIDGELVLTPFDKEVSNVEKNYN